jgi:ABC-type phosphate transport system permease subunit
LVIAVVKICENVYSNTLAAENETPMSVYRALTDGLNQTVRQISFAALLLLVVIVVSHMVKRKRYESIR